MTSTSSGAELASALLAAFTAMVEEVVAELEARGHPGVTATHEFALQAIGRGADDASSLGRRLGVSKQAAAKTITALEALGYVERVPHPNDARRRHLRITSRGVEMIEIGAEAFDALRARILAREGSDRLATFESVLATLARR